MITVSHPGQGLEPPPALDDEAPPRGSPDAGQHDGGVAIAIAQEQATRTTATAAVGV
jgi:hypothetical protein